MRSHAFRRFGAVAVATGLLLAVAIPASAHRGHHGGTCGHWGKECYQTSQPSYVDLEVPGAVQPLINSGEEVFGTVFEGLPDGIGVVPGHGKKNKQGYVDLYVTHEQSHVPFGGFADFQDSSVSRGARRHRVEADHRPRGRAVAERGLHPLLLGVHGRPGAWLPALHPPRQRGIERQLPVPAGAVYGADRLSGAEPQAGYSVYLDTVTGKVGVLAGAGRA